MNLSLLAFIIVIYVGYISFLPKNEKNFKALPSMSWSSGYTIARLIDESMYVEARGKWWRTWVRIPPPPPTKFMANSKSADKRARQNKSRYALKHAQRSIVRSAVKRIIKDVENKDKNLKDNLKLAQSTIDKIADKKVIHKNKAARLKSRLNRKVKSA